MLTDDALRALCCQCSGLMRPVYGDVMVFFEHITASRRFVQLARAQGYLVHLFGTQAHVCGHEEGP